MTLTQAGQRVLAACDQVSDTMDVLAEGFPAAPDEVEATLSLRMISDVVAPALDQALIAFHRAFPRVEIKIDIAPWRKVLDSVRRSRVTIGIACDSAPSDRLAYRPLIDEAQQLYCGAGHRLFGTPPVAADDLDDETFVLTGEDEPDELAQFRAAHKLGRRSGGSAETLHEARKLIQMGFGIGFLPTSVAEAADAAQPLWPLLGTEVLPRYPVYVVTRLDARHPPGVRRGLDAFLAAFPADRP